MKRMRSILFLFLFLGHLMLSGACSAEFSFSDERFRNKLTTENLDAIIDEYELFDGWYWTTKADVTQDFHGHPDSPGWNTTVDKKVKKECLPGWYGCRWPIDHVRKAAPDEGGYAECFAFAQFIGYLLSGELNPQHNWEYFYNTRKSDGLKKSGGLCGCRKREVFKSWNTKNPLSSPSRATIMSQKRSMKPFGLESMRLEDFQPFYARRSEYSSNRIS